MNSLYKTLMEVLRQKDEFFSKNGELLRNAVYEAAMKMDSSLIKLLLDNDITKKHFFTDIDGVLVFDKIGFGWVINNKEFLPDSYTRFKNKIGLVDERGSFISSSDNVELVFPYKDCVLEGGQTKEDQKRSEIFYNETLAPDEVDRLLYPKAFTNAKRYTVDGVRLSAGILEEDNLLIKGNNLLAISSLTRRYHNKIRMVYWDVPYNTESDSFRYNDKFSRSTWLVFIKNRVEKVMPLIKDEGGVFLIQCSFHQYAYLKVLLDEIIGNYIMTFNVLVRHPDRTLTGDKEFNDVIEYILVYSKNKDYKMPKIMEEKIIDDYQYIVNELSKGEEIDFDGKKAMIFTPNEYQLMKDKPAKENFKIITVRGSIREKNSSGRFYVKYLEPLIGKYPDRTLFKVEDIGDDMYNFRYFYLPPTGKKNGGYLQGMPTSSSVTYKPYPNFLEFVQSYNTVNNEGVVEFRNGKKPEDLIAYLMDIFTAEEDIVLDAFAGSATTATVALKMNRKFITCEQMDYMDTVTIPRLMGVITGKENDILPDIGYEGGGSFVYCELAKLNQNYVDKIESATTDAELVVLLAEIIETDFISCKVNPAEIKENAKSFEELTVDDKKRFLMELLDKNQLYVNYCDIDDENYHISEEDKAFTKSFYGDK